MVPPNTGMGRPVTRCCMPYGGAMMREVRNRVRPMKVFVTKTERERIEQRAQTAGLSVSAYLRVAGLSQPIRSVLDYDAIRELAKVNGEQGRLAGLLKLWLHEQVGQGATQIEVQRLLTRVGEMQARLAEIAGRV